jgi:hypothetical protein
MDNTWFYSLSTIAQVMAAMAGLFPIFVVFRMDKLRKEIDQFREMAINGTDRNGHLAFEMRDRELLKKAREYLKSSKNSGTTTFSGELGNFSFGELTLNLFEELVDKREQTLKKLKTIIALSIACVVFALTLLVYGEYFFACASVWLTVLILFTIFTLIYIGTSAYQIIKP